jgi:hypothetical protein
MRQQDDDDFENADINRALSKMRDISRKFGLDLHPNGVALPLAAAFIKSPPYVDKFLKQGEAFAAVLQKENSFKGDLELVARGEGQSESLFIMQVRATNRAIAIVDGLWVEVVDRLVHVPALAHELEATKQELALAKREYDDLTDLLLRVSNEPANKKALHLAGDDLVAMLDTLIRGRKFTEQEFEILSRMIVEQSIRAKIDALEARFDAYEAAQSQSRLLPPPQPQPMSNVDGERQDDA